MNRTTRRPHLTEVGTNYYARCASVLADIDEAEAEASSLQAAPRGLLRIAAPVTFGVRHIAPALSDYVTRYRDVTIEVAVSDRFVNLIEEGIDLAIQFGELQVSSLIARRLGLRVAPRTRDFPGFHRHTMEIASLAEAKSAMAQQGITFEGPASGPG